VDLSHEEMFTGYGVRVTSDPSHAPKPAAHAAGLQMLPKPISNLSAADVTRASALSSGRGREAERATMSAIDRRFCIIVMACVCLACKGEVLAIYTVPASSKTC